MKKFINSRLKTVEGWTKFKDLLIILIFGLFITTIVQLFLEKGLNLLEVGENIISGKYNLVQYILYGLYVFAKMMVIILPTIGAAVVIRFIIHKDTLSDKLRKFVSTTGIIAFIIVWLIFLIIFFSYRIYIEGKYLSDGVSTLEGLFQLYEYLLPALILTFIDYTYNEIRHAKKVEKGEKLSDGNEKAIIGIFSDERLTDEDKILLINNLKIQAKKLIRNKH